MIFLVFIYYRITGSKKSSRYIFFALLIYSGLRYDVGWDYFAYADQIREAYNTGYISDRYEPLSLMLLMVGVLFKFYPLSFFLFSLVSLTCVYLIIDKYSVNPLLSWLVYYSMPLFFYESLSTIRQGVALSLIVYAYKYLVERKIANFILFIFIASLFHGSAVAALLLLLVYMFPISRVVNFVLLIASFFIGSAFSRYIVEYISMYEFFSGFLVYINFDYSKPNSLWVLYYGLTLLNLLFYKRLVSINPENSRLISVINFGIVIYNILIFEPVSAMRISAFYIIYFIFIIPSYVGVFGVKYRRAVGNYIVAVFGILMGVYLYIIIAGYQSGLVDKISFIPYKFWFNHI